MHTENDLISIIVPVFNAENYLAQCLDSILGQTDPDWELILVDDGSTDTSLALCKAFRAEHTCCVTVLTQKNAGVSAARNRGLAYARGRYFCFVDADDWVEPDYLAVLRRTLGDSQMAICGIDGAEQEPLFPGRVCLNLLRSTPSRYSGNVYLNCSVNRLYIKEIRDRHHLAMPTVMKRGEDAVFVADYLECCETIAITDRVLYHYRETPTSAMHSFHENVCKDEGVVIQRQYALFHPNGPQSLSHEEEIAYWIWVFGKVLSVYRYIKQYAPNNNEKREYFQTWTADPLVWRCLKNAPAALGKKALLLRGLTHLGLRSICAVLIDHFC